MYNFERYKCAVYIIYEFTVCFLKYTKWPEWEIYSRQLVLEIDPRELEIPSFVPRRILFFEKIDFSSVFFPSKHLFTWFQNVLDEYPLRNTYVCKIYTIEREGERERDITSGKRANKEKASSEINILNLLPSNICIDQILQSPKNGIGFFFENFVKQVYCNYNCIEL